MIDSMLRKWVWQFKEGCDAVHNEKRSRYPSAVIDELVCAVDEKVKEKCKFYNECSDTLISTSFTDNNLRHRN